MKSYYDSKYFGWQSVHGSLAGKTEFFKFREFVKPEFNIVDFGCGGGFLLKRMQCVGKVGVEVNPSARRAASENGIETVCSVREIDDNWADLIVSNHALEHTDCPLGELRALYRILKPSRLIVFFTPYEKKNPFKENDINQHFYTWSEMNLGNLFVAAGFRVISIAEFRHKFIPHPAFVLDHFGEKVFHLLCRVYANLRPSISQIRIVAKKPQ